MKPTESEEDRLPSDLPPIRPPRDWNVLVRGCPECGRKDRLQLWIPAWDRWFITLPPDPEHTLVMEELVAVEDASRGPIIVCVSCSYRKVELPPEQVESLMWDDNIRWTYSH